MQNLYTRIVPFILLGVGVVAFVFGLILLAYLLLFGAIVGLLLFTIAWVRQKFFSSHEISTPKRPGRTIDHEE